jgi:hypothetical protein
MDQTAHLYVAFAQKSPIMFDLARFHSFVHHGTSREHIPLQQFKAFLIVVVNEATTPEEKFDRHHLHNCHVSFVEIVSAPFNLPHISLNIPESLHSK